MKTIKLLTAVVIARNEQADIGNCLKSLDFCDEIIVVDSGSVDNTVDIAKRAGVQVYQISTDDFSEMRNFGLKKAEFDWILYVDADEIVSDTLARGIISEIRSDQTQNAYFIIRQNYYLETLWPTSERILRLFKKSALTGWTGRVHESPLIKSPFGTLTGNLIHHTHDNLEEMVEKTNQWSAIEAQLLFESHHPQMRWWRFFRVMWTAFFKSFISDRGYKTGTIGLIESLYQAFSIFITYAKLWEKQIQSQNSKVQMK